MPSPDRRTLHGVYSVRQSAELIMSYRFAEERMMRMMAGWIALTPEIAVKLEIARQVYEDALHADALGKRLPELRAKAQVSRAANAEFAAFIQAIEDCEEWEQTIERLVGIHRVLKPHLISHYSQAVAAANPIFEPPTIRIFAQLLAEERAHVVKGQALLADLLDSPERSRRAEAWQAHLEGLLAASGGVTGHAGAADAPRAGRSR